MDKLKEIAKYCAERSKCTECPYAMPCWDIKSNLAFCVNYDKLKEMEAIYDDIHRETKQDN